MTAADESYARLMAARRIITPTEREEAARERTRDELRSKIRRRLPRVY